jgi:hypothetical protein
LKDLRVGESLRLCQEAGINFPKVGDIVVVYSLDIPPLIPVDSGSRVRRCDFTALIRDVDGELVEYLFDSRVFERVS